MNVFLSCVSTEFKSYRLRLANQLGALKEHPYEVKVQEDFQQGDYTLLDKLADYVRECDLVLHLAGDACREVTSACPESASLPSERALAIDEQSSGPDHSIVAIRLTNLTQLLQATNRLVEAEPLIRRAVEITMKFAHDTGHKDPHQQSRIDNYAYLLYQVGYSEEQILARLREIAAEYGISLGE